VSSIFYLIIMTILGSIGAIFFKFVSNYLSLKKVKYAIACLIVGGLFYGCAALLNIYVLTIFPYSIVFPLTSITYIWTLTLGYFLLKEKVSWRQLFGCSLIILGCFFIANS